MRRSGMAALVGAAMLGLGCPASAAPDGLAKADYQSLARARLMRGDGDGDGRISAAEWAAAAKARGAKRDPARMFGLLDRNHDGQLDADEIDALTARRFERLDADKDGKVTADERNSSKGGLAD